MAGLPEFYEAFHSDMDAYLTLEFCGSSDPALSKTGPLLQTLLKLFPVTDGGGEDSPVVKFGRDLLSGAALGWCAAKGHDADTFRSLKHAIEGGLAGHSDPTPPV